nr:DUF1588 domain-containing protein [Deltaproteobacteria bacterium]
QLGRLDAASPDPDTFPAYGEALEQDMRQELALFFEDLRARDGSMLELITSNRTFANEPLAEIYGVDGVVGDQLVPIETDAQRRAGLLTMPAILTMTSGPEQPNIVWRGVWLAETMLCVTPPPPPDDVPAAPDPTPNETERERLERHRADPQCSSCHTLIDPLGFSLEHYDALGHWRDTIDGEAIDDLGALPDGTQYEGAIELSAALASGEAFPTCVTEKLMTYALGRTITAQDHCVVSNIGLEHITPDSSLSDLLWAVVDSDAFQMEIAG